MSFTLTFAFVGCREFRLDFQLPSDWHANWTYMFYALFSFNRPRKLHTDLFLLVKTIFELQLSCRPHYLLVRSPHHRMCAFCSFCFIEFCSVKQEQHFIASVPVFRHQHLAVWCPYCGCYVFGYLYGCEPVGCHVSTVCIWFVVIVSFLRNYVGLLCKRQLYCTSNKCWCKSWDINAAKLGTRCEPLQASIKSYFDQTSI